MLTPIARESADPMDSQAIDRSTGSVVARKIWLPKALYEALPFFYLVSGVLAFFATLYVSAWFWIVPHYLLFSGACVHLGFVVIQRRARHRKRQRSQG